jgi:DMSO reductase family type II enzyme heme b subunit
MGKQSGIIGVAVSFILMLANPVFAGELVVGLTSKHLTPDPGAAVWSHVKALTIPLQKQIITEPRGGGSTREVKVKALHNGKQIAIWINWQDQQADRLNGVDSFKDAVAVEFPTNMTAVPPSPFMGDATKAVNIWQWRADWQADAEGNRHLETEQPATAGVYISPNDQNILKKQYPYKYDPSAAAVEYSAVGWSTLTKQQQQNVTARGEYTKGEWTVVFLRNLQRQDEFDAEFVPGKSTYVNFAVWNGKYNEVNGKKSVSLVWHTLTLAAVK